MALAPRGNGSGFFLSVSLTDSQDDVSTLRYELRGTDFTEALANKTAILTALAGVSGSVISSTSLSFVEDEASFSYPVNMDNGVRARNTFQLAGSTEKATLDIPAPLVTIFQNTVGSGANQVDITDAGVVAYAQLFQSGGAAFISDGEDSAFILRGRRTTK